MKFAFRRMIPAVAAVAVLVSGVWFTCRGDEPPSPKGSVKPFMRMKLEASNKILEGLTTEDFRAVREGCKPCKE